MKKKVFSVMLAAVLTVGYAQAQITFGARAGLNLTNVSGDTEDTKMKPGIQLGAVADYPLQDNFSIQAGFLFAQQGYRVSYTDSETSMGVTFKDETKGKMNLNYLQIPINAQYKHDLGGMTLLLQAGPYLGFGLGGKMKSETSTSVTPPSPYYPDDKYSHEEKIKFGGKNELKGFDFGLGIGAGLQFGNIQAGLGYNIGLMNMVPNGSSFVMKNNGLALTATYLFGK